MEVGRCGAARPRGFHSDSLRGTCRPDLPDGGRGMDRRGSRPIDIENAVSYPLSFGKFCLKFPTVRYFPSIFVLGIQAPVGLPKKAPRP